MYRFSCLRSTHISAHSSLYNATIVRRLNGVSFACSSALKLRETSPFRVRVCSECAVPHCDRHTRAWDPVLSVRSRKFKFITHISDSDAMWCSVHDVCEMQERWIDWAKRTRAPWQSNQQFSLLARARALCNAYDIMPAPARIARNEQMDMRSRYAWRIPVAASTIESRSMRAKQNIYVTFWGLPVIMRMANIHSQTYIMRLIKLSEQFESDKPRRLGQCACIHSLVYYIIL